MAYLEEGGHANPATISAFFLNWRRRDDDYPHFHSVKAEFDRVYDSYLTFLFNEVATPSVVIESCELAYINLIEEGPYWKSSLDTHAVIPSFQVLDVGAPLLKEPNFNTLMVFPIETDLSLSVTLQNRQETETQKNVLYFEIKASGLLGRATKSEADKWFTRGHDQLTRCFESITSQDVQNQFWKPIP